MPAETRTAASPAPVLRSGTRAPAGIVLLLHGGREDGLEAPPLLNLPALRMRPFARAVRRAARGRRVLVAEAR
ncbi:alpha/beta hydrolase, partial [Streptomyces filamentosus]